MANFTGRFAVHGQNHVSPKGDARLATSPLVLTTFALRVCDSAELLTGF